MQLRDFERRVQDQVVDQVCHLAKTAPDAAFQLGAVNDQSLQIPFCRGGLTDRVPKGERLSRQDDKSVEFLRGEAQIGRLIDLQLHIHAFQTAFDELGVALPDARQAL